MQKENRKDTSFYRQLYILVLPIAIQNLISAMVNSVDVLMLNYVSESAIAAVSLANQVMFVLFMFITGLTSGIAMLVAQYWGKQDVKSIEKIFGISLRFSFPITALFAFATAFFPQYIMRFFTPEAHLIELGASYLKVLSVSYLFIGFSQMYLCTVRSIERVKFSTITSTFAILLNIILNAGFIWGLFGLPQLGILGVGIATTIARGVELIICIIDIARKKSIHFHPRLICEKNTLLYKDFITYSLPALGNECVWGLAFTMYSVIMGHMGEALVAANSVVTVARNIFSVVGFGIAYGGAIILGKTIGAGKLEKAREDASKLVKISAISGIIGGLLLIIVRPIILNIVNLSELSTHYLNIMLWINSYYIVGQILNTCAICGVFRAGGDSKFGFIIDTIFMWIIMVPIGLLCGFYWKLPPMIVYFILCCDEFIKYPIVYFHYKRGKWLKDITRNFNSKMEGV